MSIGDIRVLLNILTTDQKVRGSNPFVRTHVRHMKPQVKAPPPSQVEGLLRARVRALHQPQALNRRKSAVSGNARTDSVHDLGRLPDFRVAECRAVRGDPVGGPNP
jgi:hypothetical protein